nr:immunoglobulin heavy chain junction region [Mus musculus]
CARDYGSSSPWFAYW